MFFAEGGSLKVNDNPAAVGRAAITEVTRGFITDFSDMVVTMDKLSQGPDGVEFHWTLTGTNTGPDGTGTRVRISGYEEWQIDEDGLVAKSEGNFDEAEYTNVSSGTEWTVSVVAIVEPRSATTASYATAAANDANKSPGSGCSSLHVTCIGLSDWCRTYVAGPRNQNARSVVRSRAKSRTVVPRAS